MAVVLRFEFSTENKPLPVLEANWLYILTLPPSQGEKKSEKK